MSSQNFFDQPRVINGASDLFFDIFGVKGIHSRSAIGVANLPLEACVELDLIAEF